MAPRQVTFKSDEPFASNDAAVPHTPRGPFTFLNPTTAHIPLPSSDPSAPAPSLHWSSRDSRKGRHALSVPASLSADPSVPTPKPTNGAPGIAAGLARMALRYPVWDISYDVAVLFTLGSVVWVINAFFVWLPVQDPRTAFPGESANAGGISAFVGATIFEIGSLMLVVEAVNEERVGCFGWAVVGSVEERWSVQRDGACRHHHSNRRNLVGKGAAMAEDDVSSEEEAQDVRKEEAARRAWQWWPSTHDLATHYIYQLGFLASFVQLLAATVFWVSGFTALPPIYNALSPSGVNWGYWAPQIAGGFGFVVSGVLFMLEVQKAWWLPAPGVLGWHIAVWNTIGGVGFMLSPIFGLLSDSWAGYEAGLATFWGSWAFLIGSAIQWYESLDKYPVRMLPI